MLLSIPSPHPSPCTFWASQTFALKMCERSSSTSSPSIPNPWTWISTIDWIARVRHRSVQISPSLSKRVCLSCMLARLAFRDRSTWTQRLRIKPPTIEHSDVDPFEGDNNKSIVLKSIPRGRITANLAELANWCCSRITLLHRYRALEKKLKFFTIKPRISLVRFTDPPAPGRKHISCSSCFLLLSFSLQLRERSLIHFESRFHQRRLRAPPQPQSWYLLFVVVVTFAPESSEPASLGVRWLGLFVVSMYCWILCGGGFFAVFFFHSEVNLGGWVLTEEAGGEDHGVMELWVMIVIVADRVWWWLYNWKKKVQWSSENGSWRRKFELRLEYVLTTHQPTQQQCLEDKCKQLLI